MDKSREAFESTINEHKSNIAKDMADFGEHKRIKKLHDDVDSEAHNYEWYFTKGAQSRQAEVDLINATHDGQMIGHDIFVKQLKERHEKQVQGLAKAISKLDKEFDAMTEALLNQTQLLAKQKVEIEEKDKRIEELELALTRIKSWESHPKNYGIDFGSWGLRDFYRNLADKALRGEHE